MATGKCINIGNNCEIAKKGYVVEADSANFVCPKCGKKLIPCNGPATYHEGPNPPSTTGPEDPDKKKEEEEKKKREKRKKIAIIAACVVALVGLGYGGYSLLSGPKMPGGGNGIGPDTTIVDRPIPPTPPTQDSMAAALDNGTLQDNGNGTGRISTPFGNYEGNIKDGKANGNGTMRFFKSCLISDRDPKKRVAESGDYVSGQFANNKLLQGEWYGKDGEQKGTIIVGQNGL